MLSISGLRFKNIYFVNVYTNNEKHTKKLEIYVFKKNVNWGNKRPIIDFKTQFHVT